MIRLHASPEQFVEKESKQGTRLRKEEREEGRIVNMKADYYFCSKDKHCHQGMCG